MRRITPSNINPWEGTPVDGSPWTGEQLRTLKAERPTWTFFQPYPVTLQAKPSSLWGPPPEPFVVQCPIIARTKDKARVLIVTPAGFTKWVPAKTPAGAPRG